MTFFVRNLRNTFESSNSLPLYFLTGLSAIFLERPSQCYIFIKIHVVYILSDVHDLHLHMVLLESKKQFAMYVVCSLDPLVRCECLPL